jgi:hypothetical protein
VTYKIRLNPRAFNPLTKQIIASRLWEIEQVADKDSERVIWHCSDIRVNDKPIRELYALPKPGDPAWEIECYGIAVRGQDNAIEVHTKDKNVSGH